MHLMCIHVSWDFSLHTWRFLLAYMEISPCIHGDFSFSLVRFSFIPVSILCVDHTISWCTTHLDSNILVLVITFLGVVSIPFLNQFMDSNNLVLVFIFRSTSTAPIERDKSVADVWIICPTIYKLGGLPTDWNLL